MRLTIAGVFLILIGLTTTGCSSLGRTHISKDRISITIAQDRINRRDIYEMRKIGIVEILYRYTNHRLIKKRVRPTLNVDITINKFLRGLGTYYLAISVTVREHDKILTEFDLSENRQRTVIGYYFRSKFNLDNSKKVFHRISDTLSIQLYERVKDV